MKPIVSQEARNDLAIQSGWYARHAGEDIAERYLDSFRRTLNCVSEQPDLGHLRHFHDPRLSGLRSIILKGAFRVHLLFYRIEDDCLVVFRVIHGMRDLKRRLLTASEGE